MAVRLSRQMPSRRALIAGSLLLAILPKCPLCLLAYFGVLGVAGSLSAWGAWLAPLTALSLALTILALGWRSGGRIGPALLGGAASAAILTSKFLLDRPLLLIAGLLALLAAAIWRAWPAHPSSHPHCP